MSGKQITVAFKQTVNLGNYENVSPMVSVTQEVPPGVSYIEAFEQLKAEVAKLLVLSIETQLLTAKRVTEPSPHFP